MARWIFLLVLAVLVSCRGCRQESALKASFQMPSGQDNLAILFTSSVQGYVEPCGCTSNPLGGIARLATKISEATKVFNGRVLFVDAGDLLFDTANPKEDADLCQDEARINLLLSAYKKLGLVATVSGARDLARGDKFRDAAYQNHGISALINGQLRVVEVGDFRVGLVAFAADEKSWVTAREAVVKAAGDAREKKSNVVVVLAQASAAVVKKALDGVKDIDAVILGKDPGELPAAPMQLGANGPWLIASGMQGQYLGVLEFYRFQQKQEKSWVLEQSELRRSQRSQLLDQRLRALKEQIRNENSPERLSFLTTRKNSVQSEIDEIYAQKTTEMPREAYFAVRAIPLDRSIFGEPVMQKQLQAYESEIPNLAASCEEKIRCSSAKPEDPVFVGVETCKTCHAGAYDVWRRAIVELDRKDEKGQPVKRQVGHARAWQTLEEAHKTADRSCVGCHSVGFMVPGGYCKAKEVDFRKNVQCESCHGAGSLHAKTGDKKWIRKEVPEATCRGCHHVPHIETTDSFDYHEKLKIILGPGHGSALLETLKHQ